MKKKILLLLLMTIVLTLTLTGISLDYRLRSYYKQEADQRFAELYGDIYEEINHWQARVNTVSAVLAQQDELIERVAMITHYAIPKDYKPAIFDGDKKAIAKALADKAAVSGMSQIRVWDANGELIAFFNKKPGYLSYQDGGEPGYHVWDNDNQWRETQPPHSLTAPSSDQGTHVDFHYGIIAISTETPVIRQFSDGEQEQVGYVVTQKFLSQDFIRTMTDRTGIEFAIQDTAGDVFGPVHALPPSSLSTCAERHWQALADVETPPCENLDDEEHFHTAITLQLDHGDPIYLITQVNRAHVQAAVTAGNKAILPLFLISALLALPLGIFLANRSIGRPVAALMKGVEAIRRGDYSQEITSFDDDELGQLAAAFNETIAIVNARRIALIESQEKYRNLIDNIPQSIFYKDANSVFISCNTTLAKALEIDPEEIEGKTDFDFFNEEEAKYFQAQDQRVVTSGQPLDVEETITRPSGEVVAIQTVKTPVFNDSNEVVGILGVFWEITERKRAEDELKLAAAVFDSTAEGIMITDPDLKITKVNKAFTNISGFSEAEALGQTPALRRSDRHDDAFYEAMWNDITQHGTWRGEVWNRKKNGEVYPEWSTISAIYDDQGGVLHYVGVFSDISSIRNVQEELAHRAHHDALTGLPNRVLLNDRLEHAIERASRHKEQLAVLFLDLDHFKNVNDSLGHPIGDRLLVQVAKAIQSGLRESDTVARLGGDEFILLIESFKAVDEISAIARKILLRLAETFIVDEHQLHIGASIGISLYPNDGDSATNLIKNADVAMYRAKTSGRNNFNFYTADLSTALEQNMQLEAALHDALERGEMELYFQPKVLLETGAVEGAEVLIRWHHPEMGSISPDQFIPLAEDNGVIFPLGQWIIAEATAQLRRWLDQGLEIKHLAINISSMQIARGDLVRQIRDALESNHLDPASLELEITESILMEDTEHSLQTLAALRELGVALSIDDFGTGYSSLSYIKRFPISTLKIDKSFVTDIPHNRNDTQLTKGIIALGKSLDLKVVVEGVETESQRAFFIGEGCEVGQGYLFSRPLPAAEFEAYCKSAKERR